MGPLDPSDWGSADWIGSDSSRKIELPEAPFEGAKWIWHAGDKGPNKPQGHRLFVTSLPPARRQGREGRADRHGRRLLQVHDQRHPRHQRPARHRRLGPPAVGRRDRASSSRARTTRSASRSTTPRPGPAGLLAKLTVTTADGKTTTLVTDGSWKTLENPGANWHNRALDTRGWPAAEVLGDYGMAPWGKLKFAHAGPAAAVVPAHELPRRQAGPPGDALCDRAGDLRRPPQRPSRERRLVQPRLDRLHQAGLLPRLRRDRARSAAARTPWARSSPTAGTAATSASARSAIITARSRGSARSCTSSWPTARTEDIVTGSELEGRRPARSARPTSSWARPTTPARRCPAGTRRASTTAAGTRSIAVPSSIRSSSGIPARRCGPSPS